MPKKKYIESPEKMWELFKSYKEDVKANPRTKVEYVGRDGERVNTPLEVPLTMEGFYEYVCERDDTKFNTESPDLSDYFENKDNRYSKYVRICSRISRSIRRDQIEGGMVGQYNPSITQRLNGLKETSETQINNTGAPLWSINDNDSSKENK